MKLFFATDVHGSEVCWKKFVSAGKFYEVDVLVLGGDMTGKAIVPIIALGGDQWKVTLLEQETILEGREQVDKMVATIQNRGYYPYVCDPDEVAAIAATPGRSDEIFLQEALRTAERWMAYAEDKLAGTHIQVYVCPGNDDVFELDQVVGQSPHVHLVEGRVVQLDEHHEMVSTGWSNPTPWDTHREEPDEKLLTRIEATIAKARNPQNAVFNLHAPPYGSGLDEAPELDKNMRPVFAGRALINVGSKAVLNVIEKYQPVLSLHGHIHEGKGTKKYRRTLSINPGSMYEQGILHGAIVELKKDKVGTYVLTTG